ncbi:hypothetical protein JXQ70_16785 [bacterium]|nr:hypothetical protein [bacterium]
MFKQKIVLCVVVLCCVVLLSALVLCAQEKETYTIVLKTSGNSNLTWIALPYETDLLDAEDIRNDIISQGGTCDRVYHWIPASDILEYYVRGGNNFSIIPGIGYGIVIGGEEDFSWTVVGEHDPSVSVPLEVSGGHNLNWLSLPYNSTSLTAADLKDELIADGIPVNRVYKWNPDTDDCTFYESARAGTNFDLEPGYSVAVTIGAAGVWTPEVSAE